MVLSCDSGQWLVPDNSWQGWAQRHCRSQALRPAGCAWPQSGGAALAAAAAFKYPLLCRDSSWPMAEMQQHANGGTQHPTLSAGCYEESAHCIHLPISRGRDSTGHWPATGSVVNSHRGRSRNTAPQVQSKAQDLGMSTAGGSSLRKQAASRVS